MARVYSGSSWAGKPAQNKKRGGPKEGKGAKDGTQAKGPGEGKEKEQEQEQEGEGE